MKNLSLVESAGDEIDWKQVESLYAAVWKKRPFHQAARLRRSYDQSYSFCLALLDGQVIGCGRTISDGQVHGWIHDLAVHPDFQAQGVGTLILNKLVKQLANVRYIGLLCSEEGALFYEKSGFHRAGFIPMIMRQKTR